MDNKMQYNPNKSVTATAEGIVITYTDSNKSRNKRYEESSVLKNVQTKGHSNKRSYQSIQTPAQKKLYTHAMHGLKFYQPGELNTMPYTMKMEIKSLHDQVQYELNKWKFQIINDRVGNFLTTVFHRSQIAKELATYPAKFTQWDYTKITFTQLGIRKETIIQKLIDLELFPKNYYELK